MSCSRKPASGAAFAGGGQLQADVHAARRKPPGAIAPVENTLSASLPGAGGAPATTGTRKQDPIGSRAQGTSLRGTLITSQIPLSTWHEIIGDPTVAGDFRSPRPSCPLDRTQRQIHAQKKERKLTVLRIPPELLTPSFPQSGIVGHFRRNTQIRSLRSTQLIDLHSSPKIIFNSLSEAEDSPYQMTWCHA